MKQQPFVRLKLTSVDALLLFLVVVWGGNFSLVKVAIEEIPPFSFNALRLIIASAVLVPLVFLAGFQPPARDDWPRLIKLGLFGHCAYQLFFIGGLALTSPVNSALILGCLPVAVLLLNAVDAQREPVGWVQWIGVALSCGGVYLVVAWGSGFGRASVWGDLATVVSLWCWAWYTIDARSLLTRYSPLQVTTYSMVVGTVCFLPFGVNDLIRLDWSGVSLWAWVSVSGSAVLAIAVAYLIWNTAVQRLGSARTSIYSNLVPVVAMVVAATWLNEPIGWSRAFGAALILLGLTLTRTE